MYIENSVVLSVIVPLLVNVPAVVPLPKYNPRLPLIVPVPPLFNVKLPSSVPPLELKALVLTPATPSRVPPVKLSVGTDVAVSRLTAPPDIASAPADRVPLRVVVPAVTFKVPTEGVPVPEVEL